MSVGFGVGRTEFCPQNPKFRMDQLGRIGDRLLPTPPGTFDSTLRSLSAFYLLTFPQGTGKGEGERESRRSRGTGDAGGEQSHPSVSSS